MATPTTPAADEFDLDAWLAEPLPGEKPPSSEGFDIDSWLKESASGAAAEETGPWPGLSFDPNDPPNGYEPSRSERSVLGGTGPTNPPGVPAGADNLTWEDYGDLRRLPDSWVKGKGDSRFDPLPNREIAMRAATPFVDAAGGIMAGAPRLVGDIASGLAGGDNPYTSLSEADRKTIEARLTQEVAELTEEAARRPPSAGLLNEDELLRRKVADQLALVRAAGQPQGEGLTENFLRGAAEANRSAADEMEQARKVASLVVNTDPKYDKNLTAEVIGGGSKAAALIGTGLAGGPVGNAALFAQVYEDSRRRLLEAIPDEVRSDPVAFNLARVQAEREAQGQAMAELAKMRAYGAANKGALAAMERISPGAGFVPRAIAGTTANAATSAAMRMIEGQPIAPDVAGAVQDATFGVFGAAAHPPGRQPAPDNRLRSPLPPDAMAALDKVKVDRPEQPTLPEAPATLEAQQEQLIGGLRPAMLFTRGEPELPLPDGMERITTKTGVYHFDPHQVDRNTVRRLDSQGKQNEILNLGPESKADVAATGQPEVTVTERTPQGTEVRAAVASERQAPATAREFEGNKSPGNTVAIETVDSVLAGRQAAAPLAPLRERVEAFTEGSAPVLVLNGGETAPAESTNAVLRLSDGRRVVYNDAVTSRAEALAMAGGNIAGTEVRAAGANAGRALEPEREMQGQAAPGNRIAIETPEQAISGRAESIDFDRWAARRGVTSSPPAFPESHRAAGGISGSAKRAKMQQIERSLAEWQGKRDAARLEYDAAVKRGEVRPQGRVERLESVAQGSGEAAEAAKRLLAKRVGRFTLPENYARLGDKNLAELHKRATASGDRESVARVEQELTRRTQREQMGEYEAHNKQAGYELIQTIIDKGGLAPASERERGAAPVFTARGERKPGHHNRGEIRMLYEQGMKRPGLWKKGGMTLDQAAEALREKGFTVETPEDVIDLLDRAARGERIYGYGNEGDQRGAMGEPPRSKDRFASDRDLFGQTHEEAVHNARKQEQRREIEERQARKLTAGDLDTGGDLLDVRQAENPLFAQTRRRGEGSNDGDASSVRESAGRGLTRREAQAQASDVRAAQAFEENAAAERQRRQVVRRLFEARQRGDTVEGLTYVQAREIASKIHPDPHPIRDWWTDGNPILAERSQDWIENYGLGPDKVAERWGRIDSGVEATEVGSRENRSSLQGRSDLSESRREAGRFPAEELRGGSAGRSGSRGRDERGSTLGEGRGGEGEQGGVLAEPVRRAAGSEPDDETVARIGPEFARVHHEFEGPSGHLQTFLDAAQRVAGSLRIAFRRTDRRSMVNPRNNRGIIEVNIPHDYIEQLQREGATPEEATQRVHAMLAEELNHVAFSKVMHDRWTAAGRPGRFGEFMDEESASVRDGIIAEAGRAQRRGDADTADRLYRLVHDSRAIYNGEHRPGTLLEQARHIPELARQLMQLRDEGKVTEQFDQGVIRKLVGWVQDALDNLRQAATEMGRGKLGEPMRRLIEEMDAVLKANDAGEKFERQRSAWDDLEDRAAGMMEPRRENERPVSADEIRRKLGPQPEIPRSIERKGVTAAVRKAIGRGLHDLKAFLAPAAASDEARQTALLLREGGAAMAHRMEKARVQFEQISKEFDKLTPAESRAVIDSIERPTPQNQIPGLESFVQSMREGFEQRIHEVRRLRPGALENLVQNYFPHIWKYPEEAAELYRDAINRRTMEGGKAFLHPQWIPSVWEGTQLGLEPKDWNPARLVMLKLHEMDRFIMAQKVMEQMKRMGMAKIPGKEGPPPGWVQIDDKIAKTWISRETTEGIEFQQGQSYYAPADAARVLNNYLSPGLRGKAIFDLLRSIGNTMNAAQLGLSAFHAGFVTVDTITSRTALGIYQMGKTAPDLYKQGETMAAVKKALEGAGNVAMGAGTGPLNVVRSLLQGRKVLGEYRQPGYAAGDIPVILDALKAGGARFTVDPFYHNASAREFMSAVRGGKYGKAIAKVFPAVAEKSMAWLQEYAVPRIKAGVAADMIRNELSALPEDATRQQLRDISAKVWDSVDNRLGQLVYDNLFWHRTLKDVLLLTQRSVGWNLGTVRELGGGMTDAMRVLEGKNPVTHRSAYLIALPVTVGMIGAVYQYIQIGEPPQDLKDLISPRTGRTAPDGSPERIILPSYLKDLWHYTQHPIDTVTNKLHPLFSSIGMAIRNKDFYGVEVRDRDAPAHEQAAQLGKFAAKQFVPFSITAANRRVAAHGELGPKIESFLGIQPAPADLRQTKAQVMMSEYFRRTMGERGAVSQEAYDDKQLMKQTIEALRRGWPLSDEQQAFLNGLDGKALAKLQAQSGTDPRVLTFRRMPYNLRQQIYEVATPEEKLLFDPFIYRKKPSPTTRARRSRLQAR